MMYIPSGDRMGQPLSLGGIAQHQYGHQHMLTIVQCGHGMLLLD